MQLVSPAAMVKDSRPIRLVLGGIAIVLFAWAMIMSGRIAISRIFVKYGTTVLNTAPADAAAAVDSSLEMTPSDAEVHFTRGTVATYAQDYETALKELELAVSLRPRDYYFWVELGLARDRLGDQNGAINAFNESMRLAPHYAQARWQRGNVLFRMGRYDEAFEDLRRAADSNPEYLPGFIDLAWNASRKDAKLTEQLVVPQTDKAQGEIALFFARNGKPDEAVVHYRALRIATPEVREKIIRDLIAKGAMRQAFTIWTDSKQANGVSVYDGGFEGPLSLDEFGFGWRVSSAQPGLAFSLDSGQPQSGARSLRINFTGNQTPGLELLSQLVVVEPNSHFRLYFSARTNNLVTGGPVVVVAKEAASQQILAKSTTLPADTKGWQSFSVDFNVGATTSAIRLAVQRDECSTSPCPVFGSVNFDSFSLESVKHETANKAATSK